MNSKFFDLQFIIGFFFSLIGLIVFLSSFFTQANIQYARSINLYSGIGLAIFGAVMLLTFHQRTKNDPS